MEELGLGLAGKGGFLCLLIGESHTMNPLVLAKEAEVC